MSVSNSIRGSNETFFVEVFDTITPVQYAAMVPEPQPIHWAWRNSPEYWLNSKIVEALTQWLR